MIKRLLIFLILIIAVPCSGANYYIDLDDGGSGSAGTSADPWSWADFESAGISASHDYRFLCGSSYTLSATWTVSATGNSSADPILFGAYYMNGGSPVHEDDSPSFGSVCGNAAAKPIIQRSADGQTDLQLEDEVIFKTATGGDQYLEFNSIHFRNAETAGQIYSSSNNFRYLWFYNTGSGLWLGTGGTGDADDNIIEYNHFDGQDDTNEDGLCNGGTVNCGVDMINLGTSAQSNTIQNNTFTGYDHGAIQITHGDNNIIQYNYAYSTTGSEDFFIGHNYSASGNIERFNYSDGAGQGIEILGAQNNEIYGNILNCEAGADAPQNNQACIDLITTSALFTGSHDDSGNKIYNNTIVNNETTNGYCVKFVTASGGSCTASTIEGNDISNNVCYSTTGEVFRIIDNCGGGTIATDNLFRNNDAYSYEAGSYGVYFGSNKADADAWNAAHANHTNNDDVDPQMDTPNYWPASGSSAMISLGLDLSGTGDCSTTFDENCLIDPDNTNFGDGSTAPVVALEAQNIQVVTTIIGAYGLEGGATPTPTLPLQGVAGDFKYN